MVKHQKLNKSWSNAWSSNASWAMAAMVHFPSPRSLPTSATLQVSPSLALKSPDIHSCAVHVQSLLSSHHHQVKPMDSIEWNAPGLQSLVSVNWCCICLLPIEPDEAQDSSVENWIKQFKHLNIMWALHKSVTDALCSHNFLCSSITVSLSVSRSRSSQGWAIKWKATNTLKYTTYRCLTTSYLSHAYRFPMVSATGTAICSNNSHQSSLAFSEKERLIQMLRPTRIRYKSKKGMTLSVDCTYIYPQ